MRGRMAGAPGTSRHKGRAASTARTIVVSQPSWAQRLEQQRAEETRQLEAGYVIREYGSDDEPIRVAFIPPETEHQREFVLDELRAIHDHASDPEIRLRLADEIERVRDLETGPPACATLEQRAND